MAALKNEVKAFIVQALACYDTPSEVVMSVKEEFGLAVTKQQCEAYDPTKYVGRDLSTRWRVMFEDTRKRFRDEVAEIPIASRAFRLRRLEKNLEKADRSRNVVLSNQVLEQAAKEVGDVYVNRRLDAPKAPGADGNAMPTSPEYTLSPDEDVPERPIL